MWVDSLLQSWIDIGIQRPEQPTYRTFRQRRDMYEDRGGRRGGKGVGSSGNDEDTEGEVL